MRKKEELELKKQIAKIEQTTAMMNFMRYLMGTEWFNKLMMETKKDEHDRRQKGKNATNLKTDV